MPRPVVLGNNRLTLALDRRHSVRDLYYPTVGCPNHLSGHKIRLGVWADGQFAWCDEGGWSARQAYRIGSLVCEAHLENPDLALRLDIVEAVHPEHDWWLKRVTVTNQADSWRDIRLFQTHDLRINETDIGDTAFYHPGLPALVHYKDDVYLSFGFRTDDGRGLDQWACGVKAFNGFLGTYKDAEDGHLGGKPVEQGSVDSTMGVSLPVGPGEAVSLWVATAAARHVADIETEHRQLLSSLGDDWFAFASSVEEGRAGISQAVDDLFCQSLAIVEAHFSTTGGLVAAMDSDIMQTNRANYGSVWFRDASLTAMECWGRGHRRPALDLIQFGRQILGDRAERFRPYFLQKYLPNGSLSASWHPWVTDSGTEAPFQQDETALYLSLLTTAAADHPEHVPLVRALTDFMLRHRAEDGLPLPSWDLWEERRGVHLWTTATVIDALDDAAGYLAKHDPGSSHSEAKEASERMRTEALRLFVTPGSGRMARTIHRTSSGALAYDDTPDASVLAALLRPAFKSEAVRLADTVNWIEEKLAVNSMTGGIARYEGDYYFRRSDAFPGNPWVISTMWVAQAKARLAKSRHDLSETERWLNWAVERAESTYVLAEQYDPETGEPLSVSPLPWSHVEVMETVKAYRLALTGLV